MIEQHLGLSVLIVFAGFAIGAYGHMAKSQTLILIGIAIIGIFGLLVMIPGTT